MDGRRIIESTTVVRWDPVTEPVRCACGHTHSGRVERVVSAGPGPRWPARWAPQWNWCDDAECACNRLRAV